jgi:hypothetical protein
MLRKLARVWICILTLPGEFILGSGVANAQIMIDPWPHSVVLKPTTNAPAYARGFAWLGFLPYAIGGDSNLQVTTIGLLGGVYTVSITDDATNTYVLGTLTSPIFTNIVYAESTIPLSSAGTITTAPSTPIAIPVGNGTFSLPDGLNPTNLVGISIADSNAVVDLVGTFLTLTNIVHHESHEDILLAATNDAPAGATGRAELEENNSGGTNVGFVAVEAEGLLQGTYTVDLTDSTGTNTFALGDLDISVHTNWPSAAAPLFRIFGWTNASGHAEFPLPAGLDTSNAVTISVIDSNAVVELIGDFTNPTNTFHCGFKSFASVFGGPICTNLHGSAGLEIDVIKGHAHNKFSLVAQGAPPSQKLTLFVNGVSVGSARSTKQGKITLTRLPKGIDLVDVMTVEAEDPAGNIIFSADF